MLLDDLPHHYERHFLLLPKDEIEEACYKVHALAVVKSVAVHSGIGLQDVVQVLSRDISQVIEGARHVHLNGV